MSMKNKIEYMQEISIKKVILYYLDSIQLTYDFLNTCSTLRSAKILPKTSSQFSMHHDKKLSEWRGTEVTCFCTLYNRLMN